MFERYTEKARRVIFFARYEASQYGSPHIETEYLVLGLLREDAALLSRFVGSRTIAVDIRTEIERQITRRERISISVEIPLTAECKTVLTFAAEEADRLGHRHVGTEHLLLGMLRVEGSLAARLLQEKGLKPEAIREQLAKAPDHTSPKPLPLAEPHSRAIATLDSFLAGLKSLNSEELISFFAKNAEFIDASGKRWNRGEIWRGFETLFAVYAKKNATYVVEGTLAETSELFVASVLWKNALLVSEQRGWMHRMCVVLLHGADDWEILLAQVTPVQFPKPAP
jgi:Clp amino terminal domain, pathogenicity island component